MDAGSSEGRFTRASKAVIVLLLLLQASTLEGIALQKTGDDAGGVQECRNRQRPSILLHALGLIDSVLDTLQGGRTFNDPSNHPLYRLSPNWFPLRHDEIRHDRALPLELLEGELPKDLDGVALRIGPNADPTTGMNKRLNGIIDGDGFLHSVRLEGKTGRALYSSDWINTPRRQFESDFFDGKAFFLKLGEMRGFVGLLKMLLVPLKIRAFDMPEIYLGQANTALVAFDRKVYALQENALPFEIDLKEDGTFESVGYEDFGGVLDYPVSAHPRVDPVTGEMFFHGYSALAEPPMRWGSVSPSGKTPAAVTRYIDVQPPSEGVPFAHDFAITENYVLLLDNSVRFNLRGILSGEAIKLDESTPLRFGLCKRNSTSASDIMWYTHDNAAALIHVASAWEEGSDKVVLWAPIWQKFVGDVVSVTDKPSTIIRMTEFTFDLNDPQRRISTTELEKNEQVSTAVDFPAINSYFEGRKVDCAFAGIMARNIVDFDGISKWTSGPRPKSGAVAKNIFYGDGITGGEPIVAPKSGRGKDDSCAVYIISFIHDANSSRSYLLVYDGESFGDEPVARYLMPHRVPHGLHASWVNADVLSPLSQSK